MVRIVHAHVPKTAGSAFNRNIIYNNFDSAEMFHAYEERLMKRRCYHPKLYDEVKSKKVAVGHIPYEFFSALEQDIVYVSLFREPIDRMVSFLNFVTVEQGHGVWSKIPEQQRDGAREDPNELVAALYSNPELRHSLTDLQVRYACGLGKFGLPGAPVDPFHTDLALYCTSRPNYRFGLQENFEAFCRSFCSEMGLEFSATPNLTLDGVNKADDTPEVRDKLLKRFEHRVTRGCLNTLSLSVLTEMNRQDFAFFEKLQTATANMAAA